MAAKINIEVTGYPLGSPGESEVHPYTVIASASPLVNLSLTDTVGVTQYFWSFVSRPVGSTATIINATTAVASFNPDVGLAGSYILQCSINNGATVIRNGLAFTTEVLEVRIPSFQETKEFDAYGGWDPAMQDFMRKVDAIISSGGASYWTQYDGSLVGGVGNYVMPTLDERVSIIQGTQTAPSLAFDEDLGTGIWSPGSGEIATTLDGEPALTMYSMWGALYVETYNVAAFSSEFYLNHYKESTGSAAYFYIQGIGTDDNGGSYVYVYSNAGYTAGVASMDVSAYNGTETYVTIGAYNGAGGPSYAYMIAYAEDTAIIEIISRCLATEWATLRIFSESLWGGASLVLGCAGRTGASVDEGRIQIGEQSTGKITFWNKDIYASPSWTGDYVYLIDTYTEMDEYFGAFGEVSLINAIVQASTMGTGISSLVEGQILYGSPSGSIEQSAHLMFADSVRFKVAADSSITHNYTSVFGRYPSTEFSGAQYVAYSRRGSDTGSVQAADNLVLMCETTGDDTATFRLVSAGSDDPIRLSENRFMAMKVKVVSSGVDTSTGFYVQERHVVLWNTSFHASDWGTANAVEIANRASWTATLGQYRGAVDGEFGLTITTAGTTGSPNILHVAYVTEMVFAQTAYVASS